MEDDFIGRCGITDLYLDVIDTVVFIDLPELDMELRMGEKVCSLETDRVIFDMRSPVSGRIVEINRKLETDPGLINTDTYGEGWIFRIDVKEPNEFRELLDEDRYREFVADGGDI